MSAIDDFVSAVATAAGLDEGEKSAVRRALSSTSGKLKTRSPSSIADPMACAAWQGLQPNHHKVRVSVVVSLEPKARDFFLRLSECRLRARDGDMERLKRLGVW